jgi:hypothetical protein
MCVRVCVCVCVCVLSVCVCPFVATALARVNVSFRKERQPLHHCFLPEALVVLRTHMDVPVERSLRSNPCALMASRSVSHCAISAFPCTWSPLLMSPCAAKRTCVCACACVCVYVSVCAPARRNHPPSTCALKAVAASRMGESSGRASALAGCTGAAFAGDQISGALTSMPKTPRMSAMYLVTAGTHTWRGQQQVRGAHGTQHLPCARGSSAAEGFLFMCTFACERSPDSAPTTRGVSKSSRSAASTSTFMRAHR